MDILVNLRGIEAIKKDVKEEDPGVCKEIIELTTLDPRVNKQKKEEDSFYLKTGRIVGIVRIRVDWGIESSSNNVIIIKQTRGI